ncbi:hypothetical protein PpBr36_04989 [Pyricularia pennisetigena]|uniref:hypothetical protein n=1 Tax=Pyricularia pennisetigena TaxID=1578925 RepID=UPI0011508233|nr:hypothetical protein PpBr36_04989 [Pyricularia pennisetigena]TLS27425.1 hypothetical protein PpBr36_04989 [Pyricularia pennisetigena]
MGDTEQMLRDEEKSKEAALLPGKRREKRGDEVDVVSSEGTLRGWRTAVGGTSQTFTPDATLQAHHRHPGGLAGQGRADRHRGR